MEDGNTSYAINIKENSNVSSVDKVKESVVITNEGKDK